jgi:hypothetical protein
MRDIDQWFAAHEEPHKSYFLALRKIILETDANITEAWKYRMPFYCYNGKMCCYLWFEKKLQQPYLGIVEGNKIFDKDLVKGNRARMKILLFNSSKDLPLKKVKTILKKIAKIYQ